VSGKLSGMNQYSNAIFAALDTPTLQAVQLDPHEVRQRFETWGAIVLPGFFSKEELSPVNKEMRRHFAKYEKGSLQFTSAHARKNENAFDCDVIPWEPLREENGIFRALHENEKLHRVTEAALGSGYTAPGSLVMFSVGGGRGQAWHQDCPSSDSTGYNLNRLIYTEDVDLEDGAIVFVPGSHRAGRIPPGGHQEPMVGEITLTPRAGTLVLLHGHVYHRVTPNRNLKPRTSINFRAFPEGVSPDVTCIGVYRNGDVNFCDKPKFHDGTPAQA
jgi:ectoine hydroxylase